MLQNIKYVDSTVPQVPEAPSLSYEDEQGQPSLSTVSSGLGFRVSSDPLQGSPQPRGLVAGSETPT